MNIVAPSYFVREKKLAILKETEPNVKFRGAEFLLVGV